MKRKLITILLMCVLSITACSEEPQESVETSGVVEEEIQEEIDNSEQQENNNKNSLKAKIRHNIDTIKKSLQTCESKMSILDGAEYECDFMVLHEGYIYGYDLEEIEEQSIENYKLSVDYQKVEDNYNESKMSVPVNLLIDDTEYTIGSFKIRLGNNGEIKDMVYSTGYDDVSYAKTPCWETEQGAVIRSCDLQSRTIELCYVTLVDCDTYVGCEMSKEEWITIPMSENIKITSWSQDGCGCCYITENNFISLVNYFTGNNDYFFCYITEENGELIHIGKVLNP